MRKIFRNTILFPVLFGMLGCGSASNDQGTSFVFSGFVFINRTSGQVECDRFTHGTDVSIDRTEGGTLTIDQYLGAKFQNNMSSQFIRIERMVMDYYIPGASQQPPSTTWPMGNVIPPAATPSAGENRSSLPENDNFEAPDCAYFAVMPPSILSWIDQNRDLLPEMPFTVEARVKALGVTSSGQVIYSNELSAYVNIATEATIPGTTPPDGEFPPEFTPDGTTAGSESADTSASSSSGSEPSSSPAAP